MSRRRKKNSLLPKMIGIAVAINALLLPLLAHFGAFKAIRGEHLTPVRLVRLPPPPKRPAPPKHAPPKKRAAKAHPRTQPHAATHQATVRASHPNPNQPKVVAAAPGGSGGGPAIDNSGTAAPGQLPIAPPPAAAPAAPPPAPAPAPPAPIVTPPPPAPTPPAAPPPAPPVVVAAVPLSQPRPQLPDDLSFDDIHGDYEALFHIAADGSVRAQTARSTGDAQLDRLALNAADRWTFRPALVNGKSVDSTRRLRIEFYAE